MIQGKWVAKCCDEGISGVHAKKRVQFLAMIELCKKRKIDLILTKSISRFARNTLDCIQYVRMLKSLGIPVIFEKEGIDTSDMNSEIILTCLSSFAQAESESISLNVARGKRMGFKQGRFSFRYTNCLGYRKGADGQPEIVPEEAEIIQTLFQSYLDGESLVGLKQLMESRGIPSPSGKEIWSAQTILRILQNEKYMGDILLQKSYTANFLEGKSRKNNGELPQYYIENNHPAIVSKELFRQVQEEIARRKSKSPSQTKTKTNRGRFVSKYALSEKLVCGKCGSYYRRVIWSIHGRRQIVWRCISRLEYGKKLCPASPSIPEDALQAAIMQAIEQIVEKRQVDMKEVLQNTIAAALTAEHEDKMAGIQQEIRKKELEFDRLLDMIAAEENDLLERKLELIGREITELKKGLQELEKLEQKNLIKTARVDEAETLLQEVRAENAEYSDTLIRRVVEKVVVLSAEKIRIEFIGGEDVESKI